MLISSQQREFIKWLAGLAFTVALILFVAEAPLKQILFGSDERAPASVPGPKSKTETLLQHEKHGGAPQGKGSGIVDIEIAATAGGDSILNLEATIEARSNQQDLQYAWLLPAEGGVTLASGSLEGLIGPLKEGERTTVRIALNNATTQNRRVHLHVFKMLNGEAMGRMAQYNTMDQEKIDAVLQNKADVLSAGTDGGESQKVMQ